jgi:hypothetical protein
VVCDASYLVLPNMKSKFGNVNYEKAKPPEASCFCFQRFLDKKEDDAASSCSIVFYIDF